MSEVQKPGGGGEPAALPAARVAPRTWLAALPLLAALAVFVLIVRRAWMGDDAFITLRVLDNVVSGHGLVSNPPERVLGFTHPLWALVLLVPRALGVSGYWAAMGCSLLSSLACALFVATRAASSWATGVLASAWLAGSLAFVDFSTGGLENPLAHLLLAVFFAAYARGRLPATAATTWLLGALVVLNRHDHALLVLPALISLLLERTKAVASQGRGDAGRLGVRLRRAARELAPAVALGSLPLAAWFAFALVYYGFALPNTALAKLNTTLPPYALLEQGGRYFADALRRDPQTMAVIALALLAALLERSRAALGTALGILLYLAYVARIGGDFMTGRFFSAPFVVGAVFLAARGLAGARPRTLLELAALQAVLVALHPISLSASEKKPDCTIDLTGIVIERQCYVQLTALAKNLHAPYHYERSPRFERGRRYARGSERVVKAWNIGLVSYAAGPRVHVIDPLALTDPLLAHIPYRAEPGFRIGHFERKLPKGYVETLRSGRNALENRCLHAYYDVLSKVIRGPLFTGERWRAILELHLGRHDHWLQEPCRAHVVRVSTASATSGR